MTNCDKCRELRDALADAQRLPMSDPQRYHKIQAASYAFVQHDTRDHVLHIATVVEVKR
jgi:hypothetical protein